MVSPTFSFLFFFDRFILSFVYCCYYSTAFLATFWFFHHAALKRRERMLFLGEIKLVPLLSFWSTPMADKCIGALLDLFIYFLLSFFFFRLSILSFFFLFMWDYFEFRQTGKESGSWKMESEGVGNRRWVGESSDNLSRGEWWVLKNKCIYVHLQWWAYMCYCVVIPKYMQSSTSMHTDDIQSFYVAALTYGDDGVHVASYIF